MQPLGTNSMVELQENENGGPEIREFYRDYKPRLDVKRIVEELLTAVPPEYLAGLRSIVLTNRSALSRDQRRQKIRQGGRNHEFAKSQGAYYRATRSRPAAVWLFADNILDAIPKWFIRLPFVRYVVVGGVLYHEIGHHIHRTCRPIYRDKEAIAEDWSTKLGYRFFRKRYWYFRPFFPVVSFLAGKASKALEVKLRRSLRSSRVTSYQSTKNN